MCRNSMKENEQCFSVLCSWCLIFYPFGKSYIIDYKSVVNSGVVYISSCCYITVQVDCSMSTPLVDKFIGCLLGGLVGDCFGEPFELMKPSAPDVLKAFITKKLNVQDAEDVETMLYTDDTEMAKSVAKSLMAHQGFNALDMAKRFLKKYEGPHCSHRNYGAFVHIVFRRWKKKQYNDIFDPSREQFGGSGSFGNGGAMRAHPVALFCYGKATDQLVQICRQTAQLTHYNVDGYNGAILLGLAVKWALDADPSVTLDTKAFLGYLSDTMKELESTRLPIKDYPSYCTQLENVQKCLDNKELRPADVGRILGNNETAVKSVPLAIYSFLRAGETIHDFQSSNPYLRTLYLCLAAGGDTDTIGSMACSLSGAYHGISSVPEVLYRQCEDHQGILNLAVRLAEVVTKVGSSPQ